MSFPTLNDIAKDDVDDDDRSTLDIIPNLSKVVEFSNETIPLKMNFSPLIRLCSVVLVRSTCVRDSISRSAIIGENASNENGNRYLVFLSNAVARYVSMDEIVQKIGTILLPIKKTKLDSKYEYFLRQYFAEGWTRKMIKAVSGTYIHILANNECGGSLSENNLSQKSSLVVCKIERVDCAMMRVSVRTARRKLSAWIYRGAPRIKVLSRLAIEEKRTIKDAATDQGTAITLSLSPPAKKIRTSASRVPFTFVDTLTKLGIYYHERCLSRAQRDPRLGPSEFVEHECSNACIDVIQFRYVKEEQGTIPLYFFNITRSPFNPFHVPLIYGWRRELSENNITYRTPCGRILNNMKSVMHYIRITGSPLNLQQFTFEADVDVEITYVSAHADQISNRSSLKLKSLGTLVTHDISNGKERRQITCINQYSDDQPDNFLYEPTLSPRCDRWVVNKQEANLCLRYSPPKYPSFFNPFS